MNIVSAAVECPTCGAEPGRSCVENQQTICNEHPDRILHDVVPINLILSKTTAYRIAEMLNADEDEDDEGFLYELMCVDIDFARATQDIWFHEEVAKQ
jgi:hypothetical protein